MIYMCVCVGVEVIERALYILYLVEGKSKEGSRLLGFSRLF